MILSRFFPFSQPSSVGACFTKVLSISLAAVLILGFSDALAAPKKGVAPEVQLTPSGRQLAASYEATLTALRAEITKALPVVAESLKTNLQKTAENAKTAQAQADTAKQALDAINGAKGLVEHAKGKWIGGAEKGIAQAEAALKKATTESQRDAAKKDLAKCQTDKAEGLKALKERQEAYDKIKQDEPRLTQALQAAQALLAKARTEEQAVVKTLLAELTPVLAGDKFDSRLVKAAVLTSATPTGLAEFAQQSREQEVLVEKLLASDSLMKEMLVAGGASGGRYGRAIQIYAAIRQASPKASEGNLQRLALATSLEHAVPIPQSNPAAQTNTPTTVDPVKRYLHYEKAFLNGELDPAFKDFNVWEYRMVMDCDAPDEILSWGRQMLRTYRPDQVNNPDYGWRYAASVKTDVSYGSQNVVNDLPTLQEYQNIPMNGGVCGRRAFYGRFILRSFGIPVWGVTQHKHAALSHWTPKGWVINLGAGFNMSWWDKDDAPRSGLDFLQESQAREHGQEYLKVLRAQWISSVLGEQPFNDRKKTIGGFWSQIGQRQSVLLSSQAVVLGPLGQELAEANETKETQKAEPTTVTDADRKIVIGPTGAITLPVVAHTKTSGSAAAMKSFGGGMQIHCKGGFKAQYVLEAPQSGRYALTARVASFQGGQKINLIANGTKPSEAEVPFTVGLWQETRPVEITLVKGRNVLDLDLPQGSRGFTLKDFTLKPIR